MPQRLARAKAAAVGDAGCFVLAADTVVAVGRRILPKAETEAQARRCLALLSGRRHRVMTAVVLRSPDGRQRRAAGAERGGVRPADRARRSPPTSPAANGTARPAATRSRAAPPRSVRFLSGSYSGVVGLPLFETAQLLRGLGWPLP